MLADLKRIEEVLEALPERKLAIAYSGGLDSVTLARSAEIILGRENVLLLFADSVFAPKKEKEFALQWAQARKLECVTVPFAPLMIPEIAVNAPDRCYFCKKALFKVLWSAARLKGFTVLADGENLDDLTDYRPGRKAADELNVRHIFVEAKLNKDMIRDLAHDFALPNSQAPASACLASRIPCGTKIANDMLEMVDRAENLLLALGFSGSRVRFYGDLAKVEVAGDELEKFWKLKDIIHEKLSVCGFKRIAVDIAGYSRGAVNGSESTGNV
jgi:uncharacterized protein